MRRTFRFWRWFIRKYTHIVIFSPLSCLFFGSTEQLFLHCWWATFKYSCDSQKKKKNFILLLQTDSLNFEINGINGEAIDENIESKLRVI